MATIAQCIGWWVLLSCTLGPLLTWRFFRFEREEHKTRAGSLKPTAGLSQRVDSFDGPKATVMKVRANMGC